MGSPLYLSRGGSALSLSHTTLPTLLCVSWSQRSLNVSANSEAVTTNALNVLYGTKIPVKGEIMKTNIEKSPELQVSYLQAADGGVLAPWLVSHAGIPLMLKVMNPGGKTSRRLDLPTGESDSGPSSSAGLRYAPTLIDGRLYSRALLRPLA